MATIELHTWGTPNGRKVSIMLEECGLPYNVHKVDISKGEQFKPDFLKISPNNRIPAIVDPDGPGGKALSLFESGAILIYLAEKTGKFLPKDPAGRYKTLEWLMWQMGGVGPMFGQYFHFTTGAPDKIPYAVERYQKESLRLLGVLEGRLAGREHLAGAYSIADVCTYSWVAAVIDRLDPDKAGFPNVRAWLARVGARSAVQKGMSIP